MSFFYVSAYFSYVNITRFIVGPTEFNVGRFVCDHVFVR